MLIGWSALALGCDWTSCNDTTAPTVGGRGDAETLACEMAGPGVHADFQHGGPTIQGPFSGNLQKLGVGPGQELVSTQQVGTVQRKFFFILPSLANGQYSLANAPVTYVSYSELLPPPSPNSPNPPPKVWQATTDILEIGTCPPGANGSGRYFYVSSLSYWPPAVGAAGGNAVNAASGTAFPGLVYGLLP
jgi:hypothetical protein